MPPENVLLLLSEVIVAETAFVSASAVVLVPPSVMSAAIVASVTESVAFAPPLLVMVFVAVLAVTLLTEALKLLRSNVLVPLMERAVLVPANVVLLPFLSVPPLIVVGPVYVFGPASTHVPFPVFVTLVLPV